MPGDAPGAPRPEADQALWTGSLVGLLALTTAMGQLERGANRIYGVQRDRPARQKYGRAAVLALVAGVPDRKSVV